MSLFWLIVGTFLALKSVEVCNGLSPAAQGIRDNRVVNSGPHPSIDPPKAKLPFNAAGCA
jgi:hypothetical protein